MWQWPYGLFVILSAIIRISNKFFSFANVVHYTVYQRPHVYAWIPLLILSPPPEGMLQSVSGERLIIPVSFVFSMHLDLLLLQQCDTNGLPKWHCFSTLCVVECRLVCCLTKCSRVKLALILFVYLFACACVTAECIFRAIEAFSVASMVSQGWQFWICWYAFFFLPCTEVLR